MSKFQVGQSVILSGVKDAVITQIIKINKKNPAKTLYTVTYTVDDELERSNPTGKRYTNAFTESQLK